MVELIDYMDLKRNGWHNLYRTAFGIFVCIFSRIFGLAMLGGNCGLYNLWNAGSCFGGSVSIT